MVWATTGQFVGEYREGVAGGDRALKTSPGRAMPRFICYMCEKCGTEVLCNKAGSGAFECCEGEMKLKEAKALPSSD